jgi:K+-transporting ATPase ATPase A chain
MTGLGWLQIALFVLLLLLLTKPLGHYMAKVFNGERTWLHPVLGWLERLCYRLFGVDPQEDMRWSKYAGALLAFSVVATVFAYAIMRLQGWLPLQHLFNPQGFSTAAAGKDATAMTPDLAFNTAASFATNTNWQAYGGEVTLSYLSQMLALAFHNWISAAAGICAAVALVRGFARREASGIGNFWADLTRCLIYILLPICVIGTLFLVQQGCLQNLSPYVKATTLEGGTQTIAMGPVASQKVIAIVGTNGGGFFNANSAHPFENPTPLTNLVQMLWILMIAAGLFYMFGEMVSDKRQGWTLWIACSLVFLTGTTVIYWSETRGNPLLTQAGALQSTAQLGDSGGNLEGKEVRFGQANSAIFACATTDASCGAVNCMHDSLTPLAGMVPLVNMQCDETFFGGVGSGLYGLLIYAVIAVFIAGLMVGRTPEYLGKKIEAREVKLAMLFVLLSAFCMLVFTAITCVASFPKDSFWNGPGAAAANVANNGPHGLSEMLYVFTSCTANNGSAFAGINVNTPYYNLMSGLCALMGRFLMMLPALALAGSLAAKKYTPPSAGTFPTHTPLFAVLLIGVVVIVAALTFFPVLCLGPIIEHGLMFAGHVF